MVDVHVSVLISRTTARQTILDALAHQPWMTVSSDAGPAHLLNGHHVVLVDAELAGARSMLRRLQVGASLPVLVLGPARG